MIEHTVESARSAVMLDVEVSNDVTYFSRSGRGMYVIPQLVQGRMYQLHDSIIVEAAKAGSHRGERYGVEIDTCG